MSMYGTCGLSVYVGMLFLEKEKKKCLLSLVYYLWYITVPHILCITLFFI